MPIPLRGRLLSPLAACHLCRPENRQGRPRPFSERTLPVNVFKKIIVRYVDAQGRQVRKDTPGAEKVQEFSTKYYGRVPGNPRLVPLATNKTAAELMLAQLVRQAEMEEAGIVDPFAAHRRRPLAEHLADYKNELAARDNTPAYVNLAIARLETVFDGC